MNKRVAGFVAVLFVMITQVAQAQTHSVTRGWNLIANDAIGNVDISTFPITFTTVWTWNNNDNTWNFYAPSLSTTGLASYTLSKGYGVLSTIKAGEGFWVNNNNAAATALTLTAVSQSVQDNLMQVGWSLRGNSTGTPIDPAVMFGDPTIAPLMKSVWAWDNNKDIWNFYSPGMSAADLASYTLAKGLGVLSTIKAGEGYWVDVFQCTEPKAWVAGANACVYPIGTQAVSFSQLDNGCILAIGTALSSACKASIARGAAILGDTLLSVGGHPTIWTVFNLAGVSTLVLANASNLAGLVPIAKLELTNQIVSFIGNSSGANVYVKTSTAGVNKSYQVTWDSATSALVQTCNLHCDVN
ncbi:MAG: hypothetical protein Q8L52_02705 [bacterium]|nr:hypothetical protein [bacterium]